MRKRHIDALKTLGIEREKYLLDFDLIDLNDPKSSGIPKIWGLKLTATDDKAKGKTAYIEYERDEYGGNPKYYARQFKGARDFSSPFKRQLDAIACVIQRWFI